MRRHCLVQLLLLLLVLSDNEHIQSVTGSSSNWAQFAPRGAGERDPAAQGQGGPQGGPQGGSRWGPPRPNQGLPPSGYGDDDDDLPTHQPSRFMHDAVQGTPRMHPGDIAQEPPGTTSTTSDKDKDNAFLGSDLSQVDKDLIFEGLKNLYKKKVLPLEVASKYGNFGSPPLGPSDFEAKPMVLILGQYSVGKTSFIRSLLKQDFPGQRIGPEPTTDRFTAIMHASDEGRLSPGHALVMQPDKPFRGLASFGNNFLSKFEGAEVPSSILRNITIVDTPGVLAGEKQRIGRDYDFGEIVRWFADRADMIIVMFDAHKLDISDELKMVLDALKPHHDKIRVLLNKADSLDAQSLLRVYGALMWSLGKVMKTPESCRVYLGSFWDAPLKREDNRALLQKEKDDLLNEMMSLPQNAVIRRINELVKRARSVKVHAYIIHYLRKQMPWTLGKADKQQELIADLDKQFVLCARRYGLPLGDFPDVNQYRKMLSEVKDISAFKKLDKSLVVEMDKVLTHDIPLLLQKATRSGGTGGTGGSPAAGVGVHRQQHPPNEPEQSHHGYHEQPQRQRPSKSFYQQAFGREQGGQHNPWS